MCLHVRVNAQVCVWGSLCTWVCGSAHLRARRCGCRGAAEVPGNRRFLGEAELTRECWRAQGREAQLHSTALGTTACRMALVEPGHSVIPGAPKETVPSQPKQGQAGRHWGGLHDRGTPPECHISRAWSAVCKQNSARMAAWWSEAAEMLLWTNSLSLFEKTPSFW